MVKSGVVMQVNKKIVCILTPDGSFVKVKVQGQTPSVGEFYKGEVVSNKFLVKTGMMAGA